MKVRGRACVPGIGAKHPGFDVTPAASICGMFTEADQWTPGEFRV